MATYNQHQDKRTFHPEASNVPLSQHACLPIPMSTRFCGCLFSREKSVWKEAAQWFEHSLLSQRSRVCFPAPTTAYDSSSLYGYLHAHGSPAHTYKSEIILNTKRIALYNLDTVGNKGACSGNAATISHIDTGLLGLPHMSLQQWGQYSEGPPSPQIQAALLRLEL